MQDTQVPISKKENKPYKKLGKHFGKCFAELHSKLDSILEKLDDPSSQQAPTKPASKPAKATASNEQITSLRDENEQLQASLNTIQTEKAAIATDRERLSAELERVKNELTTHIQQLKQTLAGKETKIAQQEQALKEQEEAIRKQKQALENFSKEIGLDLFETYKHLPQEFQQSFTYIQGGSLRSFVATSGSKETLINLYDYIKQTLKAQRDVTEIITLFNTLFLAYGDIYDFERLVDSKEFEEDSHIRLHTTGRGAISQCYLLGFKDGKTIYKSLVD